MANPSFYLQIVGPDGQVAHLPGGGALEANLIDLCTTVIMSKGVGFWRSSTHVEQDIRDGLREALMGMKRQTTSIA